MKTTSLYVPVLAAAYASAHGFLSSVTIDGTTYQGNVPSGKTSPSVIRQVSSPNPNYGASNPALTCGPNAQPAALIANANPGDKLSFNWRGADGSKWPHNIGPMNTYLASCGSTTCDKFDESQAKWFKISQDGRLGPGQPWVQNNLFEGGQGTATLPANLASGNYLLRHEIIALHIANTQPGKAEFYPACTQIKVGGSQTGAPTAGELVSLPGAYNDNDPGLFTPNIFDVDAPYIFPGPKIAAFVGGAGASASGGDSSSGGGSNGTSPTGGSTGSKGGKTCKVKKSKRATTANIAVVRPRHISRIMKRLEQSLF